MLRGLRGEGEPQLAEHTRHQLLDPLLVADPPDHPDTDVVDLGKVGLQNADVTEDLDHTLAHTDTRVLEGGGCAMIMQSLGIHTEYIHCTNTVNIHVC